MRGERLQPAPSGVELPLWSSFQTEVSMNKNSWCFSRTTFFPRIIVGIAVFLAAATFTRVSPAQTRSRVIVAHGVGIYSLNPYAVNTSPLTAAWGSVMESLIEPDYE